MSNRSVRNRKLILSLFLIAYTILLLKALFFKYISPFEFFDADRLMIRNVNLVPFDSVYRYYRSFDMIALMNVIGNIVIFIPMPIFLQVYINKISFRNCIYITFLTSIAVEVIQYVFSLGITDIDDIMLNTLGGIIGVLIYGLLLKIFKNKHKVNAVIILLFKITIILSILYFAYLMAMGYRIKIF